MLKIALYAVLILVLFGLAAFVALGISSRNGTAPGLVDGKLAPCPSSPNCVSSEPGAQPDKRVEPLPPDTWDRIPATISELGGTVTLEGEDYIAAEFKSAVFGFVDDFEFRKAEDAVHIRSASRVGYSDAGVNAQRVDRLRAKLAED